MKFPLRLPFIPLAGVMLIQTTVAATIANRWSFDTDTTDSVGGNTGILIGGATITNGSLKLDGGTGTGAESMGFTNTLDIGGTHGSTGVTFEAWYTDAGSGAWSKMFSFGNGQAGQNIIFNTQRASDNIGLIQYQGSGDFTINPRPALNTEHHLALSISPTGEINAWVDGVQLNNGNPTNNGSNLSSLPNTYERIGASAWNDAGMTGSVNEFRIWSGELNASEVSASMNAGPGNLPGNAPIVTSFTTSSATRQEGEALTLTWVIDDSQVTGSLVTELRGPDDSVLQTSSSASGSFVATIGDTNGTPGTFTYTLMTWDTATPADIRIATSDVQVTPGIPIADSQSVQTIETNPVAVTLTGSDPNTHPDPVLSFTVVTPPSRGTLTGTPPNLTYTAIEGLTGNDSFNFKVNDGKYDSEFTTVSITVSKSPTAPAELNLSSIEIPTNVRLGGYLAAFTTDDPNLGDTHNYALIPGPGDTNNNLFSIVGNQLRSSADFSGETGNTFSIRVRTTDQGGLFLEKIFALNAITVSNDIVINEIHANPPLNHVRQEFIELYNPSESSKDLGGWRLDSAIDFIFPPGTIIPSHGYLVVAEDPSTLQSTLGATALGPFSGSLNSSGETIRLRDQNDELIDEVDFKVGFPWPVASDGGGASIELINPSLNNSLGSSWRPSFPRFLLPEEILLPYSASNWSWRSGATEASTPTTAWHSDGFTEDGTWNPNAQLPIGYGIVNGVTINTQIPGMRNTFNSVFLRSTFEVAPGEIPSELQLNYTADDGIIVWINGVEVERKRFPALEDPTIDDLATSNGTEGSFEGKLIANSDTFLVEGTNTIAVHLFNVTSDSSDLGFDLQVVRPGQENALPRPSPGKINIAYADNAAPNIRKVDHLPSQPTSSDPVTITARVTDPDGVASVELEYRVIQPGTYVPSKLPLPIIGNNINLNQDRPENPDFETGWTSVSMRDDGTSGDALAGDDLYSITLPAQAHRNLVRYRISISDSLGNSERAPYSDDPSLNFAYYVYDGVPAYQGIDAATMANTLPVYQLLTRGEDYAEAIGYNGGDQITQGTEARYLYNWNGTMVYDGKVYDNITFRLRGANGRYQGSGKRSMRVRFNDGKFLEARKQSGEKYPQPWRTLTLGKGNSNRGTMTFGLNEAVNYHLFQKMGVPAADPLFIQWRVVDGANESPDQWRGDFNGTYFVSETYDVRFMEQHDLEKGNLYKLINQTGDWEKQQRYQAKFAPFDGSDHNTIEQNFDGNDTPGYVAAHVNLEKYYAFHALAEATRHYDYWPSANKNMVYYFAPNYLPENEFKGQLWLLPWDTDSSWGPSWNSGHDVVYNTLFSSTQPGGDTGSNPTLWPDYYNTVREMRDLLWQEDQIDKVIDEFANTIAPLVPADFARWKNAPADAGNYNQLGGPGMVSLSNYVQDMKNFAFTGGSWPGGNDSIMGQANDSGLSGTQGRDAYLDFLQGDKGEGSLIPGTPTIAYTGPANFPTNGLSFTSSGFSDPQGNSTFGAMEWRIARINDPSDPLALEYNADWESGELNTFGDTIAIPTVAVRSGQTYRARVRHQDNTGRWSHWSAPIEFTATLPDISSYLDSLVVTELMYHPTNPTAAEVLAGFTDDDLFEYIELKNVGTSTLDLTDIRFTKGVDFDFINATQTQLAPGEIILVVRSIAAFEMRYGTGYSIAGEWDPTDKLNNSSDRVKLSFGAGDTLRDFTYLDIAPWPTSPDGTGRSLTLRDPNQVPDHALPSSWRGSYSTTGTPGQDEAENAFANWLADRGQDDPNATYEGSSLSNLLAFALGADLIDDGRIEDALPQFQIIDRSGVLHPALSYRVRLGETPINYIVEVSPDLDSWESGPIYLLPAGNPADNGDGTATINVLAAEPLDSQTTQFMRLRVVQP